MCWGVGLSDFKRYCVNAIISMMKMKFCNSASTIGKKKNLSYELFKDENEIMQLCHHIYSAQ